MDIQVTIEGFVFPKYVDPSSVTYMYTLILVFKNKNRSSILEIFELLLLCRDIQKYSASEFKTNYLTKKANRYANLIH